MTTITDDHAGERHARLVVLNADVVGYSRLLADDRAATVATMREYQRVVARAVAHVGGTLVNFVGDSFVATFDDARAGMRAAIAICGTVNERNAELPRTRRTSFRMGLDVGDVVATDDGRHFGDAINVAARVQAIADTGGINVTGAVYDELDEPALRLVPLGRRRLKHIPELIRVYRLAGVSEDERVSGPRQAHRPTVAVLPFHARDESAKQIAAALHQEIVTAMAAMPGLRVLAAGSTESDGQMDASAAASAGAHLILVCDVVGLGGRMRVYVKLIDAGTVNLVWSRRWDGIGDDTFGLVDEVTADTVHAIDIELVVGEPARIYRSMLRGEELEAVYRGLELLMGAPQTTWRSALELFGSVAASSDGGVVGIALSAFGLWWGVQHGLSDAPEDDLARAAGFAARGVELGDDTGLCLTVSAALRLHRGEDPGRALADARRAGALRPTCDISYAVEGSVQRYLGRWQDAVAACERALGLASVPRPWFMTVLAGAYYVGERYHEAAEQAEQALDLLPTDAEALLLLAAAQQALGLERRARGTVDAIVAHHPGLRRADLWEHHPFRDRGIVDRWDGHLAAAGLP